jgi:hypothetical protein
MAWVPAGLTDWGSPVEASRSLHFGPDREEREKMEKMAKVKILGFLGKFGKKWQK